MYKSIRGEHFKGRASGRRREKSRHTLIFWCDDRCYFDPPLYWKANQCFGLGILSFSLYQQWMNVSAFNWRLSFTWNMLSPEELQRDPSSPYR